SRHGAGPAAARGRVYVSTSACLSGSRSRLLRTPNRHPTSLVEWSLIDSRRPGRALHAPERSSRMPGHGRRGPQRVMRPTLAAQTLRDTTVEYLTTTFALAEPDTQDALEDFLTDPADGLFRGPYLRIRRPFRTAEDGWQR